MSLNWFGVMLVIWWGLEALAQLLLIGRPRPEVTPGGAVVSILVYGFLIWGLVTLGVTH